MSMILPYHDIASAAALSQTGICAARLATTTPGEDTPLFVSPCGRISPIHTPSRWARFFKAALAPISGPTLSQSRNASNNI